MMISMRLGLAAWHVGGIVVEEFCREVLGGVSFDGRCFWENTYGRIDVF
jgi:hypothetical protein